MPIFRRDNGADARSSLRNVAYPNNLYKQVATLRRRTGSLASQNGVIGGGDPEAGFPPPVPYIADVTPSVIWTGIDYALRMSVELGYTPPADFVSLEVEIDDLGSGTVLLVQQSGEYVSPWLMQRAEFCLGHTYALRARATTRTKGIGQWSDWFTGVYFDPLLGAVTPPNLLVISSLDSGMLESGAYISLHWTYSESPDPDSFELHCWETARPNEDVQMMTCPGTTRMRSFYGLQPNREYSFAVYTVRGLYHSIASNVQVYTVVYDTNPPEYNYDLSQIGPDGKPLGWLEYVHNGGHSQVDTNLWLLGPNSLKCTVTEEASSMVQWTSPTFPVTTPYSAAQQLASGVYLRAGYYSPEGAGYVSISLAWYSRSGEVLSQTYLLNAVAPTSGAWQMIEGLCEPPLGTLTAAAARYDSGLYNTGKYGDQSEDSSRYSQATYDSAVYGLRPSLGDVTSSGAAWGRLIYNFVGAASPADIWFSGIALRDAVRSVALPLNVVSNANLEWSVVHTSADYTVSAADYTVLCNASVPSSIAVNLPEAAEASGKVYVVKKTDATAHPVRVYPASGETVDGAASLQTTSQWGGWMFQSDGSGWYVIGKF